MLCVICVSCVSLVYFLYWNDANDANDAFLWCYFLNFVFFALSQSWCEVGVKLVQSWSRFRVDLEWSCIIINTVIYYECWICRAVTSANVQFFKWWTMQGFLILWILLIDNSIVFFPWQKHIYSAPDYKKSHILYIICGI